MKRGLSRLERMWTTDFAIVSLLVLLLVCIFVVYPLGQFGSFRLANTFLFSLILISGAMTVSGNRFFGTLVFFWAILTFAFLWVRYLFPDQTFILAANGLALLFLALLTLLILTQSFCARTATSRRITGAVAAYLYLGMMWSLAYYVTVLLAPEAFIFPKSPASGEGETVQLQL